MLSRALIAAIAPLLLAVACEPGKPATTSSSTARTARASVAASTVPTGGPSAATSGSPSNLDADQFSGDNKLEKFCEQRLYGQPTPGGAIHTTNWVFASKEPYEQIRKRYRARYGAGEADDDGHRWDHNPDGGIRRLLIVEPYREPVPGCPEPPDGIVTLVVFVLG